MVDAADAITDDLDERYQAYAEAEAYLLGARSGAARATTACGWCLSKVDNDSKMYRDVRQPEREDEELGDQV